MSDQTDYENLSDEDLMNLESLPAGSGSPFDAPSGNDGTLESRLDAVDPEEEAPVAKAEEGAEDTEAAEQEEDAPVEEADPSDEELEGGSPAPEEAEETPADPDTDPQADPQKLEGDGEEPVAEEASAEDAGKEDGAADPEKDHTTPKQEEAPNYEDLYKQMMKPFKANGRDFTPASPDEAVRLMQMGANYTQKMQKLAPNLKMMRMLENKGLLDEEKLSFLIDLDQKEPEAIRKLLHESKIDPLDIDLASEPAYKPGNHAVSDGEMAFHGVMEEVSMTSTGKETIGHINDSWDQSSKQAIFREPSVLAIINEQRANGIYDQISAEIDRQKTLGQLQGMPFIQAYKEVGDQLHNAGKLNPNGGSPDQETPAPVPAQRQVLETRAAQPRKAPVTNGDKARAISSAPRSGKPAPKPLPDIYSMSDEEIESISSLKV